MEPEKPISLNSTEEIIGFANGQPYRSTDIKDSPLLDPPISGWSKFSLRYKNTLLCLKLLVALGIYVGLAFLSFLSPNEGLSLIMGWSLLLVVPILIVLVPAFVICFVSETISKTTAPADDKLAGS